MAERSALAAIDGAENADGSAGLLNHEGYGPFAGNADQLPVLREALHFACHVNNALLEHRTVSFHEWAGLGEILERKLFEAEGIASRGVRRSALTEVHPRLLAITEKIKPDEFGAELTSLFFSLSRSLEYLGFIGRHLKSDSPLKPVLPFFALVRRETKVALEAIEQRTLHIGGVDASILEALDGTAYAIRIELRKSFEHELAGLCQLRQPLQVYAKVETAHGLLRDCFQQSIVSLASLFDTSVDGRELFSSFQTKLDQSLALRRDLWRLLRLVHRIERERDESSLPSLSKSLEEFREGSLHHLMYKDWESYERFIEEIEAARGATELTHVLHRFNAYLDTLFGQVSMRAVLIEYPFDPSEAADS
ncbi:MAG: hypothetical protein WCD76_17870 [Pyrinomonadaceae bacterium]